MQGYRNPNDGLWDMPIVSNVVMPPTYPGLYPKRNMPQPVPSTQRKQDQQSNRSHTSNAKLNSFIQMQQKQNKINRSQSGNPKVNIIIRKKQPKTQLAQYLHATCQSPTASTFVKAIQNANFLSWPGLTVPLIKKHLPKSMFTYQGHMTTERQGLQSTKTTEITPLQESLDFFPPSDIPNEKTNQVCYALLDRN